jgi:hypothetical protein
MNPGSPAGKSRAARWYCAAILFFLALFVTVIFGCGGGGNSTAGPQLVLARVEVPGHLEDINLPVYADLDDGNGTYYALVIDSIDQLTAAGVTYRTIDNYTPGTRYLIALEVEPGARQEAAGQVRVLYDDGDHIIVRYAEDVAETLSETGFDLKLMSDTPTNSLQAAEAYANQVANPRQNIVAVINLDMIGYASVAPPARGPSSRLKPGRKRTLRAIPWTCRSPIPI